MIRYTWQTDAASGELWADDMDDALEQLIQRREWGKIGSRREQLDIADGAWLRISDGDTGYFCRGDMP